MAFAGDVDNDGVDDFAVGAPPRRSPAPAPPQRK